MQLKAFDYRLPEQLIAQQPVSPRDYSRLMVLDRKKKTIAHRHFYDIVDYLRKGDVLVLNNTKVFPARLIGKRKETGGRVEVFLLKKSKLKSQNSKLQVKSLPARLASVRQAGKKFSKGEVWEVLIGNRRKKVGQTIEFSKELKCEIIKRIDESVWRVKFNKQGGAFEKLVDVLGEVPIPPYIKTQSLKLKAQKLKNDYQTVFAKYKGSVAGPTAGFHFTKQLLNKLKKKGVEIEYVTLHVGLGTFASVKTKDITKHRLHAEWANLDSKTALKLNRAKKEGRRIIAVGTTGVRTLETFAKNFKIMPGHKWTSIFIYPGYKFKFVDGLITNFHLPKSTLIMLISAFANRQFILEAYQEAIKKKYRFYSFGDAMFIV